MAKQPPLEATPSGSDPHHSKAPFGELPPASGKFVYLRKGLGGEGAEVRPLRKNDR
ncbi:MAG: hypothetical protein J2P38_02155 [Candidatus Dormibacteraeota bacterium]|nr:hypothetical protein [Candidatus Dormibacteraeota bacterium]